MRTLIAVVKRAFRWDRRRELERSLRGLEEEAEELRQERDRMIVASRTS